MNGIWFAPDKLFDGEALYTDKAVHLLGGRINSVVSKQDAPPKTQHIKGLVTPGFVDLQVNGGGGILLNQAPTAESMRGIAAAHRRFGTVAIMPTVISDAPQVMQQATQAALAVKDAPFFAGLHIEGPHISISRRGTHDARFIRPLDDTTFDHLRTLREAGVPVMLTLAPEAATLTQISALAKMGVVVSVGHTDATAEQTRAAFGAGARCVTHLFNAMSQMQGRAPGVVGAAINSDVYAGFICDGVHVLDEMLGLAIRARVMSDRMFLVSDAMPTVGGPDRFRLYGAEIRVHDGRLVNAEGNLAGAHVTQAQGVARLVQNVGITLEEALRMAITVPADLIGATRLKQLQGRVIDEALVMDSSLQLVSTLGEFLRKCQGKKAQT